MILNKLLLCALGILRQFSVHAQSFECVMYSSRPLQASSCRVVNDCEGQHSFRQANMGELRIDEASSSEHMIDTVDNVNSTSRTYVRPT